MPTLLSYDDHKIEYSSIWVDTNISIYGGKDPGGENALLVEISVDTNNNYTFAIDNVVVEGSIEIYIGSNVNSSDSEKICEDDFSFPAYSFSKSSLGNGEYRYQRSGIFICNNLDVSRLDAPSGKIIWIKVSNISGPFVDLHLHTPPSSVTILPAYTDNILSKARQYYYSVYDGVVHIYNDGSYSDYRVYISDGTNYSFYEPYIYYPDDGWTKMR